MNGFDPSFCDLLETTNPDISACLRLLASFGLEVCAFLITGSFF